jgi:hypothetical protein
MLLGRKISSGWGAKPQHFRCSTSTVLDVIMAVIGFSRSPPPAFLSPRALSDDQMIAPSGTFLPYEAISSSTMRGNQKKRLSLRILPKKETTTMMTVRALRPCNYGPPTPVKLPSLHLRQRHTSVVLIVCCHGSWCCGSDEQRERRGERDLFGFTVRTVPWFYCRTGNWIWSTAC